MKKTLLLIATVLCCATTIFAQNNKISYQAVVRDTENKLVANKDVEVTVNIYNGSETATSDAVYTETQTVTTNLNGLISLMIGPDVATPAWNSIQWNQARIETTVTLDNTSLGTLKMPLTAVPYAMYADYADDVDPLAIATQLRDTANNVRGEMNTQVNNLDTKINNLANSVDTAKTNIRGEIGAKADTNKVYSRAIIDNKLGAKADTGNVYNRTIIDNKLGAKADTSSVYTRDVIDSKLDTKANANDVYTKTQIDGAKYVSNASCDSLNFCDLMGKVNNLVATVGGLNSTISGMQNTIDSLNNTIAGMQNTINDLQNQNEDFAQRVNELEELVHVVDLSTINSDVVIKDGYKVTGTLSGDYKVTIADSANVTFDGVNINGDGSSTEGHAGITCAGDATIIMAHGSTNSVNSAHENYPGIYVPAGKTLTIEGSGSLYANGNENAAGIGGGSDLPCGNIRIVEGTVTATGGAGAAGIGGGSACGTITITDGVNIVTASKGANAPNSVGAGAGNNSSCGKVTFGDVEYWDGSSNYENGGDDYLTQPTLVYHPIVTSVSLSSTFVEENVNGVFQLTVTPSPSDATVKWSVTNGSDKVALYSDADCNTPLSTVAIAAGTIYVKALAEGTATIKVASSANPAKYAECIVDVIGNNEDPVTIASTFGYCYDCQRSPAYPTSGSSCTFSGFSNPYVGNETTTGPWKLEYKESCTSNNNSYNIYLDNYKSEYNVESVPIFELLQWNANLNKFEHAAYGVVCAYSNVTGNVDHTAFFEAEGGWGCYLTGQSHSSSLHLTFDEYMSDGLHSLIPSNTLSYITVSKGSTGLSSDKRFYYAPGDTYRDAVNRSENKLAGGLGWDLWENHVNQATIFYKEQSSSSVLQYDMAIDGNQQLGPGQTITLDSVVEPSGHTYTFVNTY